MATFPPRGRYGQWAVSSNEIPLASGDRILGAQVTVDKKGRPEWVDLQYQTAEPGMFRQIRFDFPNAMFLLSLLKSIQLDSGQPFPDDPRGLR